MNSQRKWQYLLWLCFIIEAGSLTFLRSITGKYISPLLFLSASLFSIYAAVRWIRNSRETVVTSPKKISSFLLYTLIFGLITFIAWLYLRTFFKDYPVDPKFSDIIPLIRKMGDRFVNGQPVYQPVTDFGYTMYPNYLPATWMPFIIAGKLSLDYRTWAFIIFSTVLFLCGWYRQGLKLKERMMGVLFLFITFLLFLWAQPSAFGWTVEPMIAGFYLFLLLGIYLQSVWMMGLALILCLLSRYAIILWVPVLFILLLLFESKKKTMYTAIILLAGIMVLFVIPFLISTPDLLIRGYDYYTTGTLAEWKGQSWQQPGDLPFQLSQGYGFAIWFYQLIKADLAERIKWLRIVHFVLCTLIPIISIIWYKKKGKQWLPLKWGLLLSLKLYLVFFFAFIQLPFAYLFFTPLMVSALIMVWLSARQLITGPA